MPKPTTIDEVHKFLSLVVYNARFIPQHSTLTAPLRKLLEKNAKFYRNEHRERVFQQLKIEMDNNPALPLQLACDASPYSIAGVLSHIVDGEEQPVAFVSRSLTIAEKNYAQIDREALAIVFAVELFSSICLVDTSL